MADVQKVVDGIYQVNGNVNVFILDDGVEGLTIIDTGMPRSVNTIVDAVKSIGRTVGDIKQILITHADIDHIGSLAPLVELTEATVMASEQSKQYIEARQSPPHLPIFIQPFAMLMTRFLLGRVKGIEVITDGQVLPILGGIRVLALPGHTPDNIGFYWERKKVLFAPDLLNVMRGDTLNLTFPIMTWNTQIAKDSVRQAMQYQPKYICVGHGKFIDVSAEPNQVENLMATL